MLFKGATDVIVRVDNDADMQIQVRRLGGCFMRKMHILPDAYLFRK